MKRAIKAMIACAVIAVAAFAGNTSRGAPASFAYQGVIHELDGSVPVAKNRVIEFRLYDGPTSPNVLWARACNVLLDQNGLFNAPLADASGTPIEGVTNSVLAEVLADHADTMLYVGLTVDGSSGEISPRQAILAVPYAIHAEDAAGSSGKFTVAGKVTAAGLDVTGSSELGKVTAASLSVDGKVEITGKDGMFAGPGTIPVGGIIMWSGSVDAIPSGWALCNGQTNNNIVTPDLSGKFVVGYDSENADYKKVGNTGGAETVALTVDQLPKHAHDRKVITVGYDTSWNDYQEAMSFENNWKDGKDGTKNNDYRQIGPGDETGGNQPHENRPPYYVICYIMRVK
ncbi:MAG: hypothetical protein IK066_01460 [Kiritimatiellae bacterium]|nr:hypothetical protein [Kiritimatiellia bacterium]